MTRRLGLASLVVIALAFAGAAAGPARPLQSQRLVVSIVWLHTAGQVEDDERPIETRVLQPAAAKAQSVPVALNVSRVHLDRRLFQRPPPAIA